MFITRNRTDGMPPSVEIEIIGRLHRGFVQIMLSGVGVVVGGSIMAARTGDPMLWLIVMAAAATGSIRLIEILAFGRRSAGILTLAQARRWEDLYTLAVLSFTITLVALIIRIFHAGYSDGYTLAVGLAMGLSSGVCSRATRFWICCAVCTLAIGVLMAALAFTGDILLQSMAVLLGLYLLSVYEAAARNVSQLEALLIGERELDVAARQDALTGIANRRAFDEVLSVAASSGKAFSLLMLDLDGFKAINDRLGHAAGDDLLRQVAERLATVSRQGDVIARVGGDEFAIVALNADTEQARKIGERVVSLISQSYILLGSPAHAGASVGIKTVAAEGQRESPVALCREADDALYAAKRAGKGQAKFARLRVLASG